MTSGAWESFAAGAVDLWTVVARGAPRTGIVAFREPVRALPQCAIRIPLKLVAAAADNPCTG
jgi:hypothetical protein